MLDIKDFMLAQAQASPHVQFAYDLALGQVVFVNEAYAQVLHGTPAHANDELPGLLHHLHPDDRPYLAQCWARWTQGALHEQPEFRLLVPGQREQWLQLTPFYQPAAEAAGGWVGGELRDISIAKHYRANADRFNSRKNTLLELLSLDLADCLVLSQALSQDSSGELRYQISNRLLEGVRQIETISQEGVQLIHNFTNEEMHAAMAVQLSLERVELGLLLRQGLEDFARPGARAAQSLVLRLPPEPVYVELDVNKFLQVITNLLSNAIKFTPDSGHLLIAAETTWGIVRLTFQDDGIGIPADLLRQVFERHTPAQRLGLRGEPGQGMGLAQCKAIVELHQGTLRVASEGAGRGTTFSIELPQLPN